ncbi:component of SufBCD complex [Epibacterium ulvae]|uniref:component of SufBCD complex n=1 Tax=Epibacterium ulvae TaxID=1156985 RepID=UPI0024921E1F|nr:component of SufBCD complex [Epibacterium ulvae]
MELFQLIDEMIDLRSFSNLWFWIMLAVAWSSASHWIMGVPNDMTARARKQPDLYMTELETLVRIHMRRRLYIMRTSGMWIVGFGCFLLSGLAVLGFWFAVEFAQAVFVIALPMSIVALINLKTAHHIEMTDAHGEPLLRALGLCRFLVQVVGVISIFITAMWGMYQNLSIGAL